MGRPEEWGWERAVVWVGLGVGALALIFLAALLFHHFLT
jgi:hypothetical protein